MTAANTDWAETVAAWARLKASPRRRDARRRGRAMDLIQRGLTLDPTALDNAFATAIALVREADATQAARADATSPITTLTDPRIL